jgi:predicted LPLAT superfamily acyltransferase
LTVRLRQVEPLGRPLFAKEDAVFCLELPFLGLISWLAPESSWKSLCYWLEFIKWKLGAFSPYGVAEIFARTPVERKPDESPLSFALRHAAIRSEHHLQILRSYRPDGWRAPIALEGEAHLRCALEAGNGAVLWVAHFGFNALATKVAVARAGFRIFHLSRPEHGFSKSRFGIRALNPIRVHAELPHLAGRIIIDRAHPAAAKIAAENVLRRNGIVSITAGAWEGRRVATAKLLGGTIELATGAPGFALACGAALLPVFTLRDEAKDAIRVVIDRPIVPPAGADKLESIDCMTQEFADRTEPFIRAHPEQWRDWKNLRFE